MFPGIMTRVMVASGSEHIPQYSDADGGVRVWDNTGVGYLLHRIRKQLIIYKQRIVRIRHMEVEVFAAGVGEFGEDERF